jgi:hypothetical protein
MPIEPGGPTLAQLLCVSVRMSGRVHNCQSRTERFSSVARLRASRLRAGLAANAQAGAAANLAGGGRCVANDRMPQERIEWAHGLLLLLSRSSMNNAHSLASRSGQSVAVAQLSPLSTGNCAALVAVVVVIVVAGGSKQQHRAAAPLICNLALGLSFVELFWARAVLGSPAGPIGGHKTSSPAAPHRPANNSFAALGIQWRVWCLPKPLIDFARAALFACLISLAERVATVAAHRAERSSPLARISLSVPKASRLQSWPAFTNELLMRAAKRSAPSIVRPVGGAS